MQVVEIFKKLCTIPHCSGDAGAMKNYLRTTLQQCGYHVREDAAGNILGCVPGSKVTLQSHYDMVCIGKAPDLMLQQEGKWLNAEGSTLGADNGIGMAMMLALAAEAQPVDLLFTADEEIGLIGARGLELELMTPYLLNLDSEDEGVVTIGCAGGVDIIVRKAITRTAVQGTLRHHEITGLPGGHSGVDIDKGIPNAIRELAVSLRDDDACRLIDISGGERRNAIPKRALATSLYEQSDDTPPETCSSEAFSVINESETVIRMIHGFADGIRQMDEAMGIVHSSINLALVTATPTEIEIHLSARSMEHDALKQLETDTAEYFMSFGCEVKSEGFYSPWKPEKTEFAHQVMKHVRTYSDHAELGAIHAGLECGIIKEKFPAMDMASIGPTIRYPHSTRECVDLDSVSRVYESVKAVIASVKY
jgi:dipeptidase D